MRIDLGAKPDLGNRPPFWLGFQDMAGLLNLTPATKNVIVTTDNTVIQLFFSGEFVSGTTTGLPASLGPPNPSGISSGCSLVITRVQ